MRRTPLPVVVFAALLYSCGSDDPSEETTEVKPTAEFSVSSNNNFVAPTIVTFTNESENATSYEWSFGDGTTSTEANPVKTFKEPGIYTITLTSENDNDTATRELEVTITVGSILELLARESFEEGKGAAPDRALDSALKYIQLYPDFLATIVNANNITLFVPSNDAFRKLLEVSGFPALQELNPDVLRAITSYHAAYDMYSISDLIQGVSLGSLSSEPNQYIGVNSDGTLLTGNSDIQIAITEGDYYTSNGIVHIIDDVLIPPAIGTYLYQSLNTVAGAVLLRKGFTEFARLIRKADKDFVETAESKKITTLLSDIGSDWTVLAMHDTFFELMPDDMYHTLTTFPAATTRYILMNHLIVNSYSKTELTHGLPLTTASGEDLQVVHTASGEGNPYGITILQPPLQLAKYVTLFTAGDEETNGVVFGVFGFLAL